MEEHYGKYVTGELLAKWQSNPELAPGRAVSSPWPERIQIGTIEKIAKQTYRVTGEIVEVTSADLDKENAANKVPVTLTVKRFEHGWLIDDVSIGSHETNDEEKHDTVYTNTEFGFRFVLPDSWKGYSIVMDKWEGSAPGSAEVSEWSATIKMQSKNPLI